MRSRDSNNLDGLPGPEEHTAAERRSYSRAAAVARTARGGGGAGAHDEDEAAARRLAILKHEARRSASMEVRPRQTQRAPMKEMSSQCRWCTTLWRRIINMLAGR